MNEIKEIFSRNAFYTGQKETFLEAFIEDDLLQKFKKFKDHCKPGQRIEIVDFNKIRRGNFTN